MRQCLPVLLAKARENVAVAQELLDDGHGEIAASRAYYSMFYVATALLAAKGQSYSKHSAVISAYGKEFAQTGHLDPRFHRALIDAFEARGDADYELQLRDGTAGVQAVIEAAREFIEAATAYLREFAAEEEV